MRYVGVVGLCTSALLAGCGGGGGGSGPVSTPAPSGSTPTPTPAPSVHSPTASQSFVNEAAVAHGSYSLRAGATVSSDSAPAALTVSYDAAASTYSLAVAGGLQQSFGQANRIDLSGYSVAFAKQTALSDDIFTAGGLQFPATSSVSVGLWQHDELVGDRQDITLATFVYGFPTAAQEVPRSGSAAYSVFVFGGLFPTGAIPRATRGSTQLNVDFLRNAFWLAGPLTSTSLLTGETISGGGLELRASGKLTSAGHFFGSMSFDNISQPVAGTISGQFFGANAAEVGASFSASAPDGSSFVGALSGVRTGTPAINLALDSRIKAESFYGLATLGQFQNAYVGNDVKLTLSLVGQRAFQFSLDPTGGFDLLALQSNQIRFQATSANIVSSPDPNYVRYEGVGQLFGQSVNEKVVLDLYKPGSANSQLQLSYLSFGVRTGLVESLPPDRITRDYFVYGIQTPNGVLAGRTGTGRYEGIVFGVGYNVATAERYDVSGTSLYTVDFGTQSYSGSLTLSGAVTGTSMIRDFGTLGFQGQLSRMNGMESGPLRRDNRDYGEISSRFYGPDGEEIGSSFTARFGGPGDPSDQTSIGGISVARRKPE